jgi:hypothetical protein
MLPARFEGRSRSSNPRLIARASLLSRYWVAALALVLGACGAGTGEGLDQNGQPLGGGSAPLVPALEPTLASIQANVFSVNCAVSGCHGGGTVQFGLRLDSGFSAENLINVVSPQSPPGQTLTRVIPGDPDGSFLVQKLEGRQAVGIPMPAFSQPLPQATINVIRQWILDGALQ